MQPTSQQQTAIHTHDRNLIVVAGAGSGKTRVLVERYLALLDANPSWPLNALVAITFTEKAAGEMRDRVRRALEQRAAESHSLAERQIWNNRLSVMESARISTIHSLCAAILRANAAEAGIDPQFEVLDETDARLLLDDVIEAEFQRLQAENHPAVELFAEYEAYSIHQTLVDQIGADVPPLPHDLFTTWKEQWEADAGQRIDALLQNPLFQDALNWMPEYGWPSEDDKILEVWRRVWSLSGLLAQQTETFLRVELFKELVSSDTINLVGGRAAAWGGKEVLTDAKDRLKAIREMAQATLKQIGDPPGDIDQRAAVLLSLWAALIQQVQDAYYEAKQKDALLDFNDLEQYTAALLRDFPHVRARYRDAEFKHILVDEFQDTNDTQWQIVQALADLARPGSLFVVGDPKQSIYAFRGADVSVFDQVKGQILDASGESVALARSFRSHERLVAGFNHLFSRLLVRDSLSPVSAYQVELGEPMEAYRQPAPSNDPSLEVLLINKTGPDAALNAQDARRWEAYELALRLRDRVASQLPVFDREHNAVRPLEYGDVALLFQSTSNVTIYEEVFKALGLPFVTLAGRGYYNRQEVWDLLNLLRALHNPADDLSLAAALRSPLFSLSDDALFALRLLRDTSGERLALWDALAAPESVPGDEAARVAFARQTLDALRDQSGRVTIAELLQDALARTAYLATLTALPDGARRRGNVEKLLDKARTSGQVTLGAFTRYLVNLSEREVREGEALVDTQNAVTLMTVHASKGLEFPLVVLVDASWERGGFDSPPLVIDPQSGLACRVYDEVEVKPVDTFSYHRARHLLELRETAERKRLLYVAATRAQDYLWVSGQTFQDKNEKWRFDGWLSWLMLALGLEDYRFQPGTQVLEYPWGTANITIPTEPPPDVLEDVQPAKPERTGWQHPAVLAGEPAAGESVEPALLPPVPLRYRQVVRHLTATQIATLGGHGDGFRRSVLHAAPAVIRWGDVRRTKSVSVRILGEMVHEALRWWR
ncbi:MAG: UvrD-helicase domain-containing protein, partial [Anaerolineae bacterium]|nr:UvrD-helicase domain-containing protein [Anaerolineae bacterium]